MKKGDRVKIKERTTRLDVIADLKGMLMDGEINSIKYAAVDRAMIGDEELELDHKESIGEEGAGWVLKTTLGRKKYTVPGLFEEEDITLIPPN